VVLVQSVDGALRADGAIAAEAEVGELLFGVVGAGVDWLVTRFLGTSTGDVAGLGYWCGWVELGGGSLVGLPGSGLFDGFVVPGAFVEFGLGLARLSRLLRFVVSVFVISSVFIGSD
jgi:hypothetical protein